MFFQFRNIFKKLTLTSNTCYVLMYHTLVHKQKKGPFSLWHIWHIPVCSFITVSVSQLIQNQLHVSCFIQDLNILEVCKGPSCTALHAVYWPFTRETYLQYVQWSGSNGKWVLCNGTNTHTFPQETAIQT